MLKSLPNKVIFFLLLCFFLSSCGVKNYWVKKGTNTIPLKQKKVSHSIFFLGDGGKPNPQKKEPTLVMLEKLLQDSSSTAPKNKTIVFLGDNIYPIGMPKQDDKNRKEAELRINEQLSSVKNHPGLKIMIPGNHDWNMSQKGGKDQVIREQLYVENYFQDSSAFQPKNACPGPVEISISKTALLLIIDSEWWLHKHEKPYGKNSDCKSKDKSEFIKNLESILAQNKNKTVLIAMHHPLLTNGEHGGFFTLKSHLFPLTIINKKLFIPLPILGSIYPLGRQLGATRQDISNKHYKGLIKAMEKTCSQHNNVIFVGGHEHNLQLLKNDHFHQIVSGAASKSNPVRKGKKALFVARKKGLTQVNCYDDGTVNIQFLTPDEHGCAKPLFNYYIK